MFTPWAGARSWRSTSPPCRPTCPAELLGEILRGGAEKAREAGVALAGGHTVQDKEPKFGLVVLGFVEVERMLTKGGARPGDVLVLSKPLGFGTVTTALKREQADPTDISEVVGWMKRLNRAASELAVEITCSGGTDITGYSMLGHGLELAQASGVGLRLLFREDPLRARRTSLRPGVDFPGR